MNESTKDLDEVVQDSIEAAEEEVGYELTEEDLAYSRDMIKKISKYYAIKDSTTKRNVAIKAKRRAANKVQRKSRRTNRSRSK